MSGDHRLHVDGKLCITFTNVNVYVWTGPNKYLGLIDSTVK